MSEQGAVPMIVMTKSQDHVEAINSTLRKAGHPVHCTWLPDARDLGDALTQLNPEMLVAFTDEPGIDLGAIMKVKTQSAPEMPVLIVRENIDETAIAEAMRMGAQDAVTLANRSRLQSVATRELRAYRLERALSSADRNPLDGSVRAGNASGAQGRPGRVSAGKVDGPCPEGAGAALRRLQSRPRADADEGRLRERACDPYQHPRQ